MDNSDDIESNIFPILPSSEDGIDFDNLDCRVEGDDINLVEEPELDLNSPPRVIEILSLKSTISFFPDCSMKYLVINIKSLQKFAMINITCVDDTGNDAHFEISNRYSFISIEKTRCKIPMEINDGWQRLSLNLEDIMANSFGKLFSYCKEISFGGNLRISKVYFESINHSDIELPRFLRVVY